MWCCSGEREEEVKIVQLSSDALLDCHLGERMPGEDVRLAGAGPRAYEALAPSSPDLATPRHERQLRQRIRLPRMHRYPDPPLALAYQPGDCSRNDLFRTYQDFVLDLNKGIHMTQITPSKEFANIHCQLLDDLQTLKVDQGSGCIVEFPLSNVSRVYRIFKNECKNRIERMDLYCKETSLQLSTGQHIIVMEFMHRKLAFVFSDSIAAQRFFICIDLLILRVQEGDEPIGLDCTSPPALDGASTLVPIFSRYTLKENESQSHVGGVGESEAHLEGAKAVCECRPHENGKAQSIW